MNEYVPIKYGAFAQVASSVVHEMKNPLSAITLGLEYLQIQGADGSAKSDIIKNISLSTSRLNAILEALHLFFIEEERGRQGLIKLSAVLEKARLLLNYFMARNHISIDIKPLDVEPWILGSEAQILTLCFLLLYRASAGLKDGGRVETAMFTEGGTLVLEIRTQGEDKGRSQEDCEMHEAALALAKANKADLELPQHEGQGYRLRFLFQPA